MSEASSLPNRRGFLAVSAAVGVASMLSAKARGAGDTPTTQPSKQGDSPMDTTKDNEIRPFQFNAPEEALVDLQPEIGRQAERPGPDFGGKHE